MVFIQADKTLFDFRSNGCLCKAGSENRIEFESFEGQTFFLVKRTFVIGNQSVEYFMRK